MSGEAGLRGGAYGRPASRFWVAAGLSPCQANG